MLNVFSSQDHEVVGVVRTLPASSTATFVVIAAIDKNKNRMLQASRYRSEQLVSLTANTSFMHRHSDNPM